MKRLYVISLLLMLLIVVSALAVDTGNLIVDATPDGEVFVDEVSYGNTPKVINLTVGMHQIRISTKGYISHETEVNILNNTNYTIEANLFKAGDVEPATKPSQGGFFLRKGKSLFELSSKFDGKGFGVIIPKNLHNNMNLNLYTTDIRKITIVPKNIHKHRAIHIKTLKDSPGYQSYELLTTLKEEEVVYYEITLRVRDETINPDNVRFVIGREQFRGERVKKELNGYYYKFRTDKLGILTTYTE